ncbi:hypothetical protein QFZ75_008002 [Streptomyces sp. V3I8]|uniref:hypothetical protein n=1 Tax=Streptomyces sp. V3I8 TaxID=3042279 RepID=UPI0027847C32|nr:hypothetical protein [Streptomyces sp. V3I8]MDQ1041500.1 hypothetical protein [Streptomyces sp. V3I8]
MGPKHYPTQEDILSALSGQDRPFTTGDITYGVAVLHFDSPGSVEAARKLVSPYGINAVVSEMANSGALVGRPGRDWRGPRPKRAGNTKRRLSTVYYALPATAAAWDDKGRAEDAERRNARAHERAVAAVVAAHQDEYSKHYQAVITQLLAEDGGR